MVLMCDACNNFGEWREGFNNFNSVRQTDDACIHTKRLKKIPPTQQSQWPLEHSLETQDSDDDLNPSPQVKYEQIEGLYTLFHFDKDENEVSVAVKEEEVIVANLFGRSAEEAFANYLADSPPPPSPSSAHSSPSSNYELTLETASNFSSPANSVHDLDDLMDLDFNFITFESPEILTTTPNTPNITLESGAISTNFLLAQGDGTTIDQVLIYHEGSELAEQYDGQGIMHARSSNADFPLPPSSPLGSSTHLDRFVTDDNLPNDPVSCHGSSSQGQSGPQRHIKKSSTARTRLTASPRLLSASLPVSGSKGHNSDLTSGSEHPEQKTANENREKDNIPVDPSPNIPSSPIAMSRKSSTNRKKNTYPCPFPWCDKTFTRKNDVLRHVENAAIHRRPTLPASDTCCSKCGEELSRADARARHEKNGACGKRTIRRPAAGYLSEGGVEFVA